MSGALSHIRVLDLSRILAGPWAGQMLADFGAEVIKIERPGKGDDTRQWGPPFMQGSDAKTSEAAYFHAANRGKQSVAVDMACPEGQAIIRELVKVSDVLLENYKVGGLKQYGLDYDSLKALNPRLIYCSITGFGQDGPDAQRAGYDFMIQGMGGLMSVTGEPDGMPMKAGVALVDVMTGLYAANAVQAALLHREETGMGQYIDLALLDVQVATLANQAMNFLASGVSPERLGNAHPNIVPYQAFPTADGHIILAVGNDQQFTRFCEAAGRPELAADPAFSSNQKRVENRNDLIPFLLPLMKHNTTEVWLAKLGDVGVPCGPINTIAQVFDEPQIKHREMQISLEHRDAGNVPSVANPVKFSKTPITYRQAPPVLGEHSEQVLKSVLDMTEKDIEKLCNQGVIQRG
ncbi:CaiB/BaiF CoA transferase family protein [Neptunomonas antarctica]|uniref:Crotonobetainyl-CoA:carnitine CoA-transferase CaiB n=1 Tax=Neptunomonas antarctica TaxID=619304 RepID=A0A1N7LLG7_9GAMM|nr:CaiB/BaiF CoA-transferase family protein [Neptunomonas antarctica]SIS74680.1 Crotonobetainyl-CoA:carnitine CoA-transferase CaiB [Neptunomonas antarctica]